MGAHDPARQDPETLQAQLVLLFGEAVRLSHACHSGARRRWRVAETGRTLWVLEQTFCSRESNNAVRSWTRPRMAKPPMSA